ncbi:GNAT family N-acetyltransferase [Sutcliffiella rhizosphaerae]|uniref:N-acetyltransferase domain-containing protein n=1 Tax=Sutcliffiella rhizosphaerae TaxID=2880967 RepID=A0ABM8YJ38_9BACI|nr:GNAT family N-acetyltransferase [Sutcliffiella rhizosphaerae]CAG9619938.1 hypothetical protein BACCIP111883_00706 [Sutcliffiella rhizosphaerae]
MYHIKRLSDCTLNETVEAWNKGFEGYFFDVRMDVDRFTSRLGNDNISASLSFVAFDGNTPIGLLLSGVKLLDKEKFAWNGGTGVASSYRRKGVGKLLVDQALEVYMQEGVHVATLEAIATNEKAIKLYESKGYEIIDNVIHLTADKSFEQSESNRYYPLYGAAVDAQYLPLYQWETPWQSQWWCMKDGQSIQLLTQEGETVAYALFKRHHSEDGTLKSVTVTHCFIKEEVDHHDKVLECLLSHLFPASTTDYQCTMAFFKTSNQKMYQFLLNKGFTHKVEQVWMKKIIKSPVIGTR